MGSIRRRLNTHEKRMIDDFLIEVQIAKNTWHLQKYDDSPRQQAQPAPNREANMINEICRAVERQNGKRGH